MNPPDVAPVVRQLSQPMLNAYADASGDHNPIHVDEDPLTCVVRGTGRILDEYEKYRTVLTR